MVWVITDGGEVYIGKGGGEEGVNMIEGHAMFRIMKTGMILNILTWVYVCYCDCDRD